MSISLLSGSPWVASWWTTATKPTGRPPSAATQVRVPASRTTPSTAAACIARQSG
jgi:hypothetical protein